MRFRWWNVFCLSVCLSVSIVTELFAIFNQRRNKQR